MPIRFSVPPKEFLAPTSGYARNDLLANGNWVRNAISRNAEHLLCRQTPVIPGKNVAGRTVRNSSSALQLWFTHVSPPLNMSQLVIDVQLLPTDTSAGSPRWWVVVDGVSQGDQFHNVRCSSGAGTNFDDIFEMQQTVVVDALGGSSLVELWTDDNCRIVGWDMHFKPKETLDSGNTTDFLVDYSSELPLSQVRRVSGPQFLCTGSSTGTSVWGRQRAYHLNWQVDDPASPINASSTAPSNFWGGTSIGPTAPTQYRNSYANENLLGGIAAKSIRTYVWAYGERTAGTGNVIVRFISDSMPGGYDLLISGGLAKYSRGGGGDTLQFTLLPQAAGDCIRAQYLVSSAGTTGKIYAIGCYQLYEGN